MKTAVKYDINAIKDEARQLIEKGLIDRQQPIYALYKYIFCRDWACVELELEENNFLLRDRIIDLVGSEDWQED